MPKIVDDDNYGDDYDNDEFIMFSSFSNTIGTRGRGGRVQSTMMMIMMMIMMMMMMMMVILAMMMMPSGAKFSQV